MIKFYEIQLKFPNQLSYELSVAYRKRGKIRWAKHSWFQPYKVFCRNTFVVHWPPVFIIYLQLKIHGKTFVVLSKTTKTVKVQPSKSFPVYGMLSLNYWHIVNKIKIKTISINYFTENFKNFSPQRFSAIQYPIAIITMLSVVTITLCCFNTA